MELNRNTNILIVGLGLLGGSYARALTKKGYTVRAIEKRESALTFALAEHIIAEGYTAPTKEVVGEADLVIFALYPHALFDWVEEYGSMLTCGTVVTDVTGVKGAVVNRIQSALPEGVEFISAHPMAGKERGGVEYSDDSIFQGANYIVVPTEKNSEDATRLCAKLGEELGFARISYLTPREHDEMVGFVSQLTHCIAITLMTCNQTEHLEDYTGDSFRDLTRIARINDEMWSELFLLNREALLAQMDAFTEELATLRHHLENGDREALREMMRTSTRRRALFDKKD